MMMAHYSNQGNAVTFRGNGRSSKDTLESMSNDAIEDSENKTLQVKMKTALLERHNSIFLDEEEDTAEKEHHGH